eukprot:2951876-Rhodomonas_salina.2
MVLRKCYDMTGTELGMLLQKCYDMTGTEEGYGGTRGRGRAGGGGGGNTCLCAYGSIRDARY